MYEDYVKDFKVKDRSEEELNKELIRSINKAKNDLKNANRNYEFAEDELIDYYLYQIKANQAKLNYLLKKAKKTGVIMDRVNEIEIRKEQYLEQLENADVI